MKVSFLHCRAYTKKQRDRDAEQRYERAFFPTPGGPGMGGGTALED